MASHIVSRHQGESRMIFPDPKSNPYPALRIFRAFPHFILGSLVPSGERSAESVQRRALFSGEE